MTKRLWQLHSWLGLICGAGLLVIGVTGSLLVFHDEIEALVHPRMLKVTPGNAGRLPLDQLVATMTRAFPDYQLSAWTFYRNPRRADVVYTVKGGETEPRVGSIDQYTGEIRAAPMDINSTFTGWMLNLHYKFFAGTTGVVCTGVLAILLCLLGLSGLWLYRSFWKNFFRLRWGKSARILFSDFHKTVGISSVAINLILGVTGAYFNIIEISGDLRSGSEKKAAHLPGRFYADAISLDQLLVATKNKLSGFEASYIAFPQAPKGFVSLGGRVPTRNFLRSDYGSSATFDAETGALQQTVDMRRAPLLTQILDTVVPLHFGNFGGVPVKILWCLAGLAPGALAVSGFLIWRSRKHRRVSSA